MLVSGQGVFADNIMMLLRLALIMALLATFPTSVQGTTRECASLLVDPELPPLLNIYSTLPMPELFSITAPDRSAATGKLASAHEAVAASGKAFLMKNLRVKSVISRTNGVADFVEIIPPRYPDGTLLPLKKLRGAHWAVKLAAKAAEEGIEYSVGFATSDYFESGSVGHHEFGRRRIALSWQALSAKGKKTDVEVHEWDHMKRALATLAMRRKMELPQSEVTIDAGMRFYLKKADNSKALYEVVDGTPGQDVVHVREIGPDAKNSKTQLIPRDEFFATSEAYDALRMSLQAPFFTSLNQYGYGGGYTIEESAVHLASQIRMGLTNLERLAAAFKAAPNPVRQLAILYRAAGELGQVEFRTRLVTEMINESTTALRILIAGLRDGTGRVEENQYAAAFPKKELSDRYIALEGGITAAYSSAEINWHRPRGKDWSKDSKVVAEVFTRTVESLDREKTLAESESARFRELQAQFEGFKSVMEALPGVELYESRVPPDLAVMPKLRGLFAVRYGSNGEVGYSDLKAMIEREIPFTLYEVDKKGTRRSYGKAQLKSLVVKNGIPRLLVFAQGQFIEIFASRAVFDFGERNAALPKPIIETRAERVRSALLLLTAKGVLDSSDLERLRDSGTEVRVVYRESPAAKTHVKGRIKEIVYAQDGEANGFFLIAGADGNVEKVEFGRVVIVEPQ